jgi:hypothetical protein
MVNAERLRSSMEQARSHIERASCGPFTRASNNVRNASVRSKNQFGSLHRTAHSHYRAPIFGRPFHCLRSAMSHVGSSAMLCIRQSIHANKSIPGVYATIMPSRNNFMTNPPAPLRLPSRLRRRNPYLCVPKKRVRERPLRLQGP